jgi:hypothetical protein
MNDLINCGIVHLETADLINLYQEFIKRQDQAAADQRPGKPVLFGALADIMASEIAFRYLDEEERREILQSAG